MIYIGNIEILTAKSAIYLGNVGFGNSGRKLSSVVQLVTPTGADSKSTYASISNGIEQWIEDAIAIRGRN
jgi:hypothetical protein